ncbi:MAG: DUF2971 domain-containing protein [Selenomonadaceae bacterium]|nr:DUF2971 domain-containing protein [Selenomonadaceae bacterium]
MQCKNGSFFIPRFLYKYCRFNAYWKDIFEDQRLYMPSPDELNDPFEGKLLPIESGTAGNIISLKAGQYNREAKQYLSNYRILSLSANIRNKAMWAYYAENYCGFAIQFNTSSENFSSARRVLYRPNYEINHLHHLGKVSREDKLTHMLEESLFYKSKDWENEEEFRIIKKSENRSGKAFQSFVPEDVSGIILGAGLNLDYHEYSPNVSDEKMQEYRQNVDDLKGYAQKWEVPIYCSWPVPLYSTIEFYEQNVHPRLDGSSYRTWCQDDF